MLNLLLTTNKFHNTTYQIVLFFSFQNCLFFKICSSMYISNYPCYLVKKNSLLKCLCNLRVNGTSRYPVSWKLAIQELPRSFSTSDIPYIKTNSSGASTFRDIKLLFTVYITCLGHQFQGHGPNEGTKRKRSTWIWCRVHYSERFKLYLAGWMLIKWICNFLHQTNWHGRYNVSQNRRFQLRSEP